MRNIAVLALMVTILSGCSSQPRSPKREFMDKVRARIEKAHPEIMIKGERDFGFDAKVEKFDSYYIGLDNMYAAYQNEPDRFNQIVDMYVSLSGKNMPDLQITWEKASRKLLPMLKAKGFLDEIKEHTGKSMLVSQDFGPDIVILIAIDSNNSLRFVTKDDLERWNKPQSVLLNQAIHNLSALTEPLWEEACKNARREGYFTFDSGDSYDASRMILPEFRRNVSRALDCDEIAVAVPTRDHIAAVPADSPKQVEELKKVAQESYDQGPYSITASVFKGVRISQ